MNRRKLIEIDPDEQRAYLADAKTIILVSNGRDGHPHPMPMWFVIGDDGAFYMTTYGRSQKAVNIRRDPKVSLLVESGATYDALKGVFIRGTGEVVEDQALCVDVLSRIQAKHLGLDAASIADAMAAQARKRVVIKITPERVTSWDHRKLGGVY
jgi:PPOX class probable F420-dependent enzyme